MQTRLLSSVYDSAKVGDFVSATDADERFDVVLGRLRLDALLYDRVILVDADLADGTFFLAAAHRNRLAELPWNKIELRNRSNSLEESILGQFVRAGSDWLVPFTFSSMPLEKSVDLAERLNSQSSNGVSDLTRLAGALSDAGLDKTTARWYLDAWKKYCSEVPILAAGNVAQWTGGFNMEQQLAVARDAVETALETERGREAFKLVVANWRSRNDVTRVLASERDFLTVGERSDYATIKTWYMHSYKAAQGNQHSCDALEVFPEESCRDFAPTYLPINDAPPSSGVGCRVPHNFLSALGKMRPDDFSRICNQTKLRRAVNEWRTERNESALSDALGLVVDVLDDGSLSDQQRLRETADYLKYPASLGTGIAVEASLKALTRRKFVHLSGLATMFLAGISGIGIELVSEISISGLLDVKKRVVQSVVQMENRRIQL
ncbi:MAG TPA: hypothetical protein VJ476_03365 [Rhizomicrobium sp.]|nr:hypothetical protein [Rhizomicrobium sp.]